MPSLLDDLKDKAQTAINAIPYIPGREGSMSSSGARTHTLEALHQQFRSLQVQYGSTTSKDVRGLQLIITGEKGIVLDHEKEGQDIKAVSKEFYVWGQDQGTDIKDVTDRLAYLKFIQGSHATALASALDASRAPFKALRDAEAHMQPKRNIRTNYELQISRLKNEGKPGTQQKIRELESLLKKAEDQDESLEKEIELLKRKAIIDSETLKWTALREYGEKLVLLSQASKPLLEVLPSVPPSTTHPYSGAAATAATRAALQKALDNYEPGNVNLPTPSDTDAEIRSFGETHASELSRIPSVADHQNQATRSSITPPLSPLGSRSSPPPGDPAQTHGRSRSSSLSIDPITLNNTPAAIPSSSFPATTDAEPQSADSAGAPTVAETGVPVVAGKDGPGPATGSLAGGHRGSQSRTSIPAGPGYGEAAPSYGGNVGPKYPLSDGGQGTGLESAEDEKKRLEREEREKLLREGNARISGQPSSSGASASVVSETAEEEKRRLEREEREKILNVGSSGRNFSGEDEEDGNVPPPYEEPR